MSPPVCFLTLTCCAENVRITVVFGQTQRHAVTWPLRTTARGWFLYCCCYYLQSNWARSALTCLSTSSPLAPTCLWYAWNLGAFCLTTGCDSRQPPVRQCGLIEQALEFLSWSPLVVFIPYLLLVGLLRFLFACNTVEMKIVFFISEGLCMWAAAEPVPTCRWAGAVLVFHIMGWILWDFSSFMSCDRLV